VTTDPLTALRRLCLALPATTERLSHGLHVPVDWHEIAELVTDAYRTVAPERPVAELDGR
jgi:hypothetical protein